jgi:hypothetical protein
MGTTAFCVSAKVELPSAAHCFLAPVTIATMTGTTSVHLTALSGTGIAGIAVGMSALGTNVPASFVSLLVGQNALDLNIATSGAPSNVTFSGDAFKILLIKASPTGTYTGTQTNVGTPGPAGGSPSLTNVGTDETSGAGYSAGGLALTNISPSSGVGGTTAGYWSFSVNPSWSSASFSTTGANIYNTSARLGAAANGVAPNLAGSAVNRVVSYHDFGGTQTVTAGTFTILLPTNQQGSALLQIS